MKKKPSILQTKNQSSVTDSQKAIPPAFCPLPWTHISIKPNGVYRLCCQSNVSEGAGVLKDEHNDEFHVSRSSWTEDIINSKTLREVRISMLQGKWHKACVRCKKEYRSGLEPRNHYERKVLSQIMGPKDYPDYETALQITDKEGKVDPSQLLFYMDVRFGNYCNLKCIMCGPTDSSSWYEDHQALYNKNFFQQDGKRIHFLKSKHNRWKTKDNVFNWHDNLVFKDQIQKNLKQIRYVFIAGGEPLLIKSHYDFLKECVEAGLPQNIVLDYNTNITIVPKKVLLLWKHFKKVKIGMSVDALGSLNEYIRFPSIWGKIKSNLNKLDKAKGSFELRISLTVSLLNIWHLPKLLFFVAEQNFQNIGSSRKPLVSFHPLHKPFFYNINLLDGAAKEALKDYFQKSKKAFSERDWETEVGRSLKHSWEDKINHFHKVLSLCEGYMNEETLSEKELDFYRKEFIWHLDRLDQIRKTKWKTLCPELYRHTFSWRSLSSDHFSKNISI